MLSGVVILAAIASGLNELHVMYLSKYDEF